MGAIGSCSKCPKREEEENTDFSKTNLHFHIMEFSNYSLKTETG